jgi:hypothetical protein
MEPTSPAASYSAPMSVKDWLITLIITAIPVVGIIMLFVWAFGSGTHPSKQNWAKAGLIMAAIVIVLYMIFGAIFGAMYWNDMQNGME